MSDAIAYFLGGIALGTIAAWPTFWRQRPAVVRSEVLGRWIAARSRDRIEAP